MLSSSTPRHGNKQTMWSALPNLVAKNEWEVHLKDVQRLIEELTMRLTKLERGRQLNETQIMQLNHTCKEVLVTKQAMRDAEDCINSRFDEKLNQCNVDLADLRSFAKAEVESASQDLNGKVTLLDDRIAAVARHVANVDAQLQAHQAFSQLTFTDNKTSREQFNQLRDEQQNAVTDITTKLDIMDELKASKAELHDAHSGLEKAHVALGQDHEQTLRTLDKTCHDLVLLEKQTNDNLRNSVAEINRSFAGLEQRVDAAVEKQNDLITNVDSACARLEELGQQSTVQGNSLNKQISDHSKLDLIVSDIRSEAHVRCDNIMEELKTLDRRERHSWEQFLNKKRDDQCLQLRQ